MACPQCQLPDPYPANRRLAFPLLCIGCSLPLPPLSYHYCGLCHLWFNAKLPHCPLSHPKLTLASKNPTWWQPYTLVELGNNSGKPGIYTQPSQFPHPLAPLIKTPPPASIDYLELFEAASTGEGNRTFEFITSLSRTIEVAQLLAKESVLAVDSETNGLDPYLNDLLLLQIATPTGQGYIFDAGSGLDLSPLQDILSSNTIVKILQNAKFDYKMLKAHAGIEIRGIYDTFLAEQVINGGSHFNSYEKGNALANLAFRYLDQRLDKTERNTFIGKRKGSPYSQRQLEYAIKDVHILFPIKAAQEKILQTRGLQACAELEFACVSAVADMELNGILIDRERWQAILLEQEAQKVKVATELVALSWQLGIVEQYTMFGVEPINLDSNRVLLKLFNEKLYLGMATTAEADLELAGAQARSHSQQAQKEQGRGAKLSKEYKARGCNNWQEVIDRFDHIAQFMTNLLAYRGYAKTLSTFGVNILAMIHPSTGRIHPNFRQIGTDTGRLSASHPNVQQIPSTANFRTCFIARPGYKLITCDYSQAELRILAELSKDSAFIEAFRNGGDLHQLTASQMFQVPVAEITKEQRNQAKAINFGLIYGMGASSLGKRIGVTEAQSGELIARYFGAYRGVEVWLEKVAEDAVRKGYSETPLGRKRFYHLPQKDDVDYRKIIGSIKRQAKNAPIQGANADMTKFALVYLKAALQGLDAYIVNTVHDEIVVEVHESIAELVCAVVSAKMIEAGQQVLTLVPVKADAHIGDCWQK